MRMGFVGKFCPKAIPAKLRTMTPKNASLINRFMILIEAPLFEVVDKANISKTGSMSRLILSVIYHRFNLSPS